MSTSKPTDDVKIQTLLASLEELCEGDDDERYVLRMKTSTTDSSYQGEIPNPIYAGEIVVQMFMFDEEDITVLSVGEIPDSRHARKLVACANAVPQLLDYIRQLEAKVGF